MDSTDQSNVSHPNGSGEPRNRRDILADINKSLDAIEVSGSFAAFTPIPIAADNLGLFVQGVGDIGIPLREEQARQLIAQSRQAPFGRGSETVVDTSVRNTWELDASQFGFRHDDWFKVYTFCIQHTARQLGITSPIRAEPYKMLIYETGAMFKAHTESAIYRP